jgi:hypothetical protein
VSKGNKWLVRAYYADGERLEEYASEADAWAATKEHLRRGVAVAGPSGRLDPDDQRARIKKLGVVVDDIDDLDIFHRKWKK